MSKTGKGISLSDLQERLDEAKVIVQTLVSEGVIEKEYLTYWKNIIIIGALSNKSITLHAARRMVKRGHPPTQFNPNRAVRNLLIANGYRELSIHQPRGVVYEQFPFAFDATISEEQLEWLRNKLTPRKRSRSNLIDCGDCHRSDDEVINIIETMIIENPVYEANALCGL